jgi:hypothetical protein
MKKILLVATVVAFACALSVSAQKPVKKAVKAEETIVDQQIRKTATPKEKTATTVGKQNAGTPKKTKKESKNKINSAVPAKETKSTKVTKTPKKVKPLVEKKKTK